MAGLLLAWSAAACASSGTAPGAGSADKGPKSIDTYRKEGIKVAVADAPPYSQILADGKVTGASPEILRAVLKRLGIEIKDGVVTTYDAMIPGLAAQRWDVVAAGMVIKESRCKQVLFSEPDIVSTMAFGVPAGNPRNIKSIADGVANKDLKIAVLPGTFEEGVLKKAGVTAGQLVTVNDPRSGLEAVKAKRADAYFYTTLSLRQLVKDDKSFDVTEPPKDSPVTGAGVAFRTTDTELLKAYNEELNKFKATTEYVELMKKFGFDPEAVKGVTTAEMCKTAG
ncbi:ectoine/hydroxyectoine ABC transporter substrate-binding protein EhuB [Planosporangium flavigriseum]|nr:ectoine/hydroxyectoine ABC transporter substrate-binding protein EhuB [Planosporangium flavigriseum]NJC63049.1 ectoine/hydroxyectoine ABC transporter substrate-binding protein EhuB [Planosporangium flavigriseum]